MVQGSPVATQSPHMWRFCAPHSPSAGRADSLSQSAEMVASANSDGRKSRISHSPKYFSVSRSSVLRISAGANRNARVAYGRTVQECTGFCALPRLLRVVENPVYGRAREGRVRAVKKLFVRRKIGVYYAGRPDLPDPRGKGRGLRKHFCEGLCRKGGDAAVEFERAAFARFYRNEFAAADFDFLDGFGQADSRPTHSRYAAAFGMSASIAAAFGK